MNWFKLMIGCFILFGVLAGAVAFFGSGEGIIALEGYEHGVSFCESEYSTVIHLTEAHVWNDGIATYVINQGHYHDPEVKELVKLTHKACAQYTEGE